MKYKVKNLLDKYVGVISKWDGVECVMLNEAALPDVLDPYFALILDVFYSGTLPDASERPELYGIDAGFFESTGSKDRFLDGDIPVRFEFKEIEKIDELISIAASVESLYLIKDSGTYGFYRLTEGKVLFSRSDRINILRAKLSSLPNAFWDAMRQACQSKMEHFLGDLGAALIQEDDFFYLMSASGFIKAACLTIFCINRRFEPSHRKYYAMVSGLPVLPPSFGARLETFLRSDETKDHRYSAARLIAVDIVKL